MLSSTATFSRRFAFRTCGAGWWLLRNKANPSLIRAVADFCHDRFCKPCAAARAVRIRNNLLHYLDDQPVRLITLTLQHHDIPLKQQLDRLYRAFRKLRSSALWRSRIRGGLAVLELTNSDKSGLWHPHLHVLAHGLFLPQADLAKTWLAITGDSRIVDVRLARSARDTARYVTKYITKPFLGPQQLPLSRLTEAINALAGRRLLVQFGSWLRWRLTRPDVPQDWSLLAHSNELTWTKRATPHELNAIREQLAALPPDQLFVEFAIPPPTTDSDA